MNAPPEYSPPAAVPNYTEVPNEAESSLEYSPRLGLPRYFGRSTINKRWKCVSLTLNQTKEDDSHIEMPIYTRNSSITGELEIEDRESIEEVSIQLLGRLDVSVSSGGGCNIKVASVRETLWKAGADPAIPICPAVLGFALKFPLTYEYKKKDHRLPPSYDVSSFGIVVLMASCSYNFIVNIIRIQKSRIKFWKSSSRHTVPLCYRPRTRPIRPVLRDASLLSYIKACPEEYLQIPATLEARQLSGVQNIQCLFFLPSVQTFCLKEMIPCHIQMIGPMSSLQEFLPPEDGEAKSGSKFSVRKRPQMGSGRPLIRVFLARQIFIDVNGRKTWRTTTIGEGKVEAVSPSYHHVDGENSDDFALDWHAEVQCRKEIITVQSVGFASGPLTIKDFLVFSLTPAWPQTSPLKGLHHAHPIRLVTDPWFDDNLIHPQDS